MGYREGEAKETPYSYQTSLNTGSNPAPKGTNNLEATERDKICNIWDMASNCLELTTETGNDHNSSCTQRGVGNELGLRFSFPANSTSSTTTFRPLLVV